MPRPHLVLSLALLAVLTACGEKHYFSVGLDGHATPVDKHGVPLPGQAPAATEGGMSANPHAAMPGGEPADGPINVTIELDPKLGVNPASFKCGFLAARRNEGDAADAVARFDPKLPASLVLAPAAGKHGGGLTKGAHKLFARLDADGDAGTIEAGDVMGMLDGAMPGGAPVTLVLSHVMTAEEVASPEPAAPVAPSTGGGAAQTPEDLAAPRFKGRIELAPDFAALDGRYSVWVIVRSASASGGPPLLTRNFPAARFPFDFDLGTENAPMKPDNLVELISGDVKLFARLAVSGDAKGGAGDIESEPQIVRADKGPFVLKLTKKRTQ